MAIIGCSGKIGSGKDTVAKIIQYLTTKYVKGRNMSTFAFIEEVNTNDMSSIWQIHKFADALKDIVCILTGCTRNQLEDIDFKNSKLGDEWIRYGYADGFIKKYIGDAKMGEPIMTNKQCSKEEYEEHYRTNWQTAYKSQLTYRGLLQYLGTNLLRNKLHENVWINALMSKYKGTRQTTISKDCPRQGIYDVTEADELQYGNIETIYPNWIITDVRFPNEAKAIKDRYGIIIRINRKHGYFDSNRNWKEIPLDYHPSEIALDNSTIEELIEQVKQILIKEKII